MLFSCYRARILPIHFVVRENGDRSLELKGEFRFGGCCAEWSSDVENLLLFNIKMPGAALMVIVVSVDCML